MGGKMFLKIKKTVKDQGKVAVEVEGVPGEDCVKLGTGLLDHLSEKAATLEHTEDYWKRDKPESVVINPGS